MNKRDIIQANAESMSTEHTHLVLEWATGCGKTKAVLRCIDKSTSKLKWLIVIPELLQIENYKNEIEKQGYSHLLGTKIVDIVCYASLPKYKGTEFNLVLNECHRLSQEKHNIVETIKFDRIISDSATIPKTVKARLYNICPYYEYKVSLEEAIKWGILPEPSVYVIDVELDNSVKRHLVKKGKSHRTYTDKAYLDWINNMLEWYDKKQDELQREGKPWQWIGGKKRNLGMARKVFMSKCKTEMLQKVIEDIKDKRFICFTGSIEQCDLIGGSNVIHSKKGAKHNKKVLEDFNNYEINAIFAIKMGREALNLAGIETVVVTQLGTGNDEGLEFIQIAGRGLRAEMPEIIILRIKGTADERFVTKALSHLDTSYIKEYKWSNQNQLVN